MRLFKFQREDADLGDCVMVLVRAESELEAYRLVKKEGYDRPYRRVKWTVEEIYTEGEQAIILELFTEDTSESR